MRHRILFTLTLLSGCAGSGPVDELGRASASGDVERVRQLLDEGRDPDRLHDGYGALQWAGRSDEPEVVRALLDAGADPNLPDGTVRRWTPLMHAVHTNAPDAVVALLDGGASVDATTPAGATALLMAAGYGRTTTVRTLLDAGANPRAETRRGLNALVAAAGAGSIVDFMDGPPFGRCFPDTIRLLRERAPDLAWRRSALSRLVEWLAPLGGRGCSRLIRELARS